MKTIRPILFIIFVFVATYAHCWQGGYASEMIVETKSKLFKVKVKNCVEINLPPNPIGDSTVMQ